MWSPMRFALLDWLLAQTWLRLKPVVQGLNPLLNSKPIQISYSADRVRTCFLTKHPCWICVGYLRTLRKLPLQSRQYNLDATCLIKFPNKIPLHVPWLRLSFRLSFWCRDPRQCWQILLMVEMTDDCLVILFFDGWRPNFQVPLENAMCFVSFSNFKW